MSCTKRAVLAWLVRQREGKARRAIYFCGKEYIPTDDTLEIVRCRVAFATTPKKARRK